MNTRRLVRAFSLVILMNGMLLGLTSRPVEAGAKPGGAPQVVVISLDGARADIVEAFLRSGVLDRNVGLGRLDSRGVVARQNITLTPSLTAVSHIGIATGSSSAQNDIPSNTFHPVAATIATSISGFAAPIGGYVLNPLGVAPSPTAEPLWVRLRQAGKKVVYPNNAPLFTHVIPRPDCADPGFCADDLVGQDTGDVLALMAEGYNFDGAQSPVVARLGDADSVSSTYSVPNFYGAHGHDSSLPSMSAILYAAGPSVKQGQKVNVVRNIDIAPTVLSIFGVAPAPTVEGEVLKEMLRKPHP